MKKIALGLVLGCMAAMTTGCGAIPEYLIDTAKSSAKVEIDERVDELVSDVADEMLDEVQLGDWSSEEVEEE